VQNQVDRYTDFQRRRLEVKPGLTGWAQVNGRNSIPWEKRIELDVWYVDHRSLWLDALIVLRTPLALIPRANTHYGPGGVVEDFKGSDQ
jgi:lipopolysaccharide/colanic/teichoic acid biosynthesis glycosyltransferase